MIDMRIPPMAVSSSTGPLKMTIWIGEHGFSRTEILPKWSSGDTIWVDRDTTKVDFMVVGNPKSKTSLSFYYESDLA
jgi:hypothetical protein